MTGGEMAYLAMVVGGACIFALALAWASARAPR